MKALVAKVFGDSPQHEIEEREVPQIKEGFSLVRIVAATVNPLSNTIRNGGLSLSRAPLVLSNDGSGFIQESDIFPKGTRVAVYGGGQLGVTQDGLQQEWALIENKRLFEIPADYSMEYAAALPVNFVTAYQAMTRVGHVRKGQVIAISGATGSVGHALVQTAVLLGAIPVAIVSDANKAEHARKSGAGNVIDLSSQDLLQEILKITNGVGADAAFDQVGGKMLGMLISAVRPRGTVVSIGFVAGSEGCIDIPDLVIQEKKLLGYDAWMETDEDVEAAMESIKNGITGGQLWPVIDSIYPLSDHVAAYERLNSRAAKGTILLKLSTD